MISRQSFCVVVVAGRLGKDPEVRYMPQSNQAVAKFSIATTEAWQSQSGEKKERTGMPSFLSRRSRYWRQLLQLMGLSPITRRRRND